MLITRSKAAVAAVFAALVCASSASAQMTCTASLEPTSLRYYGAAELLGDLLLTCTGGRTPSPGEALPKYQIIVSADAPMTMRTLDENDLQSIQWTEALLVVDEPAPRDQRPCVPDAELAEEEPELVDCGDNDGVANVFQGLRLQDNAIVFRDTPLSPPGANGTLTLRVANIRVDVRDLTPLPEEEPDPEDIIGAPETPDEPEPAPEVYLTTRVFGPGGGTIPVEGADQLAGTLAPDVVFEVRTAADLPAPEAEPVLLTTPTLTPQARPEDGPTFLIKFTELSKGVFRRRNIGTNGVDPTFLTSQANPGYQPHTESGFFNAAYPNVRGLNQAGLADSGTRIRVVLDGVPEGVRVWFSYRDVETGTTGYDEDVPRARLTAADGGVFRPQLPEIGDYIEIWPSAGRAEALWEITSSDPDVIESLAFSVGLTGPNRDVQLGEATIYGDIAPGYVAPDDDFTIAAEAIPSFDTSPKILEPRPAFSIVPALEVSDLVTVSAAAYTETPVAPGSIVAAFGENLTAVPQTAFGTPRNTLGSTKVNVIDSAGALRPALIFAVNTEQVNVYIDPATRVGPAVVTVYDGLAPVAEGVIQIANVAPGLFSAGGDGQGPPAGQFVKASPAGTTIQALADINTTTGRYTPRQIDVSGSDTASYLVLYGTGIRRRASLNDVSLTIGGLEVPVTFAGEQPEFLGLDQINAGPLPRELAGSGLVNVQLRVAGQAANKLQLDIR